MWFGSMILATTFSTSLCRPREFRDARSYPTRMLRSEPYELPDLHGPLPPPGRRSPRSRVLVLPAARTGRARNDPASRERAVPRGAPLRRTRRGSHGRDNQRGGPRECAEGLVVWSQRRLAPIGEPSFARSAISVSHSLDELSGGSRVKTSVPTTGVNVSSYQCTRQDNQPFRQFIALNAKLTQNKTNNCAPRG